MLVDDKDRKIMYELDVNSRSPVSAIAKKVRLDAGVVNYRINKLIENKVVLGFYSIIDVSVLGYEEFRIYLKFQYIDLEKEKGIIDFLCESEITWWVGTIDGVYDLGFVVWVEDIYEFNEFWERFMQKYRNYFQKILVSIYAGLYQFPYAFISPKKIQEIPSCFTGSAKTVSISKTDERILKELASNSRSPTIEIAKKLGLTAMIVKYSVKKMQKLGVIKGFRTRFNTGLLDLTHYKVNINLADLTKYSKLLKYAIQHPNIVYVDQTIGVADFEFEAVTESHGKFLSIIKDMKTKFPAIIRDYDYFVYSKIHKIKYF
ncbi:AsnC family transcriptional regulator [Candidatus Micrarchaeota archaeon]|nr:AsnC family transcriptional regulator [Candidatus Micrarchaeota archaeon]